MSDARYRYSRSNSAAAAAARGPNQYGPQSRGAPLQRTAAHAAIYQLDWNHNRQRDLASARVRRIPRDDPAQTVWPPERRNLSPRSNSSATARTRSTRTAEPPVNDTHPAAALSERLLARSEAPSSERGAAYNPTAGQRAAARRLQQRPARRTDGAHSQQLDAAAAECRFHRAATTAQR